MVTHAVSGGKNEVMGLMQGKVSGNTFIVLDAFGLPVEGVETSVSAGDQALSYLNDKNELTHQVNVLNRSWGVLIRFVAGITVTLGILASSLEPMSKLKDFIKC